MPDVSPSFGYHPDPEQPHVAFDRGDFPRALVLDGPDRHQSCQVGGDSVELADFVDELEAKPEGPGDADRVRAELDAAMFVLFGIERDDVDYIMETFQIVKRKDIAEHGEHRTMRMILEIYDAMAEAERTGVPYASPLTDAMGKG